MPGITGILHSSLHPSVQADHVQTMTARMVHESFHHGAIHAEATCQAHLGWVGDAAFSGNITLRWDEPGRIGVLSAGEEVSGLLASLPATYAASGTAALRDLNGQVSGVILDRRDGSVVLFNDRFGLNRIYLHRTPDGFYFSSESKSLLAVLPGTRSLDERGLAECFTVGCTLQNRSLFQGIEILPPASAWIFRRDGSLVRIRYFDPAEWEKQGPLAPDEYCETLVETFRNILPRYVRPGDGTAMSLTGGLDSRMVLAWAHPAPHTLPCYTFGGPYRDCADVTIARRLAAATGQDHQTIPVSRDFLAQYSALAERSAFLSDGTMDASGAVELFCNAHARRVSPRRLTGNYGSEVLRENIAFRPSRLHDALFEDAFRPELDRAARTYDEERACDRMTFILFKQVPWHHISRRCLEGSQLNPVSPFLDNDLAGLAYRCPVALKGSPAPLLSLIARGDPRLMRVPTDRSLELHRHGWVGRVARGFREFTAKAEYAYDYGMPPVLTRIDRRLRPLQLEKLFLGRHKFYHFRTWYRGALASQLKSLTDSLPPLPAPFREGIARNVVEAHTQGRANFTLAIHRLIACQVMLSRLLRQS